MQGGGTERAKMGDADWKVECLYCGRMFEARRSDATYCSARCRVAQSREPKKLQNTIDFMTALTVRLDNYAKKYRKNKAVFDAMRILKNSVEMSLERFEID